MKQLVLLAMSLMTFFSIEGSFVSCMNDDDISTSSSDYLSFSTDTVAFDTVISGQPTNTHTFIVYNKNQKALHLSRVYLKNGTLSAFRVNVDGTFLENGYGGDFEIAGRDSMYVFVEMTAPETNSDFPTEVFDLLTFVTNAGIEQSVTLTAYGQDVIPLNAITITKDTILSSTRPYQVFDSLVVAPTVNLTLAPGVRLYFHSESQLIVHGVLHVQGTLNAPVIMRGDRLGNMFSNQPYDRIPGQWGGIIFTQESFNNIIQYADIHSARLGIRCDSSDTEKEKLRLENSIVHNMSGDCIQSQMSRLFVGNTQITNAGGNCVTLYGGHNTFIHCTIGNFYAFTGGRGVALEFSNEKGDFPFPLQQANFINSIITGYSTDEIMGNQSERYGNSEFNYLFQNCLLNTPEYEDNRIIDCIWDNNENTVCRDENFFPAFDLDKLLFTFELNEESRAVNSANPEISREFYPTDRKGRSRFLDSAPDMGCYEGVFLEGN